MANTYSNLFYHLVFSTRSRQRFIHRDIEEKVWAYIGGIARKHAMTALKVGGIEDHAHILVMAKPVVAPCDIAKFIKADSSRWIHEEFSELRGFAWQDGYGVFSVSKSAVPDVIRYISDQRRHHAHQTFEDEYRSILRLNGVDYDEKYLFD
ncbi:MAG: IS200/IS605 family transposase [Acidobacteria bacterium]|nr:IS200/IS605 family transposase [Acidobacteriota bacterium]